MPFEAIEFVTKHNAPPQASISYERPERHTKKGVSTGKRPRLMISIPTTLSGVTKKEHFMLCVGTGKDAGKARITGQNVKNTKTTKRKDWSNATTWDFGYVPMLGMDAAAKEFVAVRKISDDEFEIDLPAWFKPEEPAEEEIPALPKTKR